MRMKPTFVDVTEETERLRQRVTPNFAAWLVGQYLYNECPLASEENALPHCEEREACGPEGPEGVECRRDRMECTLLECFLARYEAWFDEIVRSYDEE